MDLKTLGLLAAVPLFVPLLFIATSGEAQQKELREVHLNVFTPITGVIVGRARGLFTAEGLNVNVTVTRSSTEQMRGISAGTFNVAQTSFDNVLAWSGREGAEIIAVAQQADWAPLPVFVRPEIKGWQDLKGKKLAVDAVDTAFALTLRRMLFTHGLEGKRGDYELVPVGAPVPRLESMKRGDTVAAIINPPFDLQAIQAGMVRLHEDKYPGSVWAVNRAWAQSHRGELVGFLRAWLAGSGWAKDPANRDEGVRLIMAEMKLPQPAALGRLADVPADGALVLANMKMILDVRMQFGTPPPLGTALERYYDTSFYRDATAR